jgi:hypothetical protein
MPVRLGLSPAFKNQKSISSISDFPIKNPDPVSIRVIRG